MVEMSIYISSYFMYTLCLYFSTNWYFFCFSKMFSRIFHFLLYFIVQKLLLWLSFISLVQMLKSYEMILKIGSVQNMVYLKGRVSLVEQELLTLPEQLSSPPVFSGVRVTRSLVLYVCFVDRCLSFCTFFFWSLCCLFLFDIRILIAPLVSSNSSQYVSCQR